jgi:predicted RNA-binding Zn ribbon-like protein
MATLMSRFEFFFWSKADFDLLMETLTQISLQQQQILNNQQQNLNRMSQTGAGIMSALDDLKTQVTENTNLERSAIQLIEGIAKQLEEAVANNDTAAIQALSSQLKTSATGLAAAISENTQVTPVKK